MNNEKKKKKKKNKIYLNKKFLQGNYGTYLTIIHSVLNRGNVKAQQKELFREKPSYVGPRLKFRSVH